jgi:hypothetical protein
MIQMSKQLLLKGSLILFLSTGPSIACDPEEMINELRTQCREGIASVAVLIEPLKSQLTIAERGSLESKINEATALCNTDKYTDGYMVSAKLARFIGHLEAQKGISPVL